MTRKRRKKSKRKSSLLKRSWKTVIRRKLMNWNRHWRLQKWMRTHSILRRSSRKKKRRVKRPRSWRRHKNNEYAKPSLIFYLNLVPYLGEKGGEGTKTGLGCRVGRREHCDKSWHHWDRKDRRDFEAQEAENCWDSVRWRLHVQRNCTSNEPEHLRNRGMSETVF